MSRKLTDDEFKDRVYKLVGNEYTFLEPYQGVDTKIKCRHNKCDNVWEIRPANFYHGYRCPKCSHKRAGLKRKKDTKWYKARVLDLVGDSYTVLGTYVDTKTPILMRHNVCGKEWDITPNNFIKGRRCPQCKHLTLSKNWYQNHQANLIDKSTLENYFNTIKGQSNIRVIGKYAGFHKKIEVVCLSCGNHWFPRFDDLLYEKTSCPRCTKESRGEKFIRQFLTEKDIRYTYQKTYRDLKDKQSLSYDYFLPECNTLIEYQGGQHYYPVDYLGGKSRFFKQQKHDEMKYQYAKTHGIRLIYIPYICDTYEKVFNLLKLWNLK